MRFKLTLENCLKLLMLVMLSCSIDLLQILRKLNCHVYVIDFGISSIFNIEDLVDYKGFDFNPSNFLIDEPSQEPIFERPFISLIPNILPLQWIRLIKFWMKKLL